MNITFISAPAAGKGLISSMLNEKYGYGVDFNFFDNFIPYIKIMLYGLSIADILFMFREKDNDKIKDEKKV